MRQKTKGEGSGSTQKRTETAMYTANQLAMLMGISLNGVYSGLRAGTIPHIRIGRRFVIPKAAVDAWFLSLGKQTSASARQ